jgi:hypothetical protein
VRDCASFWLWWWWLHGAANYCAQGCGLRKRWLVEVDYGHSGAIVSLAYSTRTCFLYQTQATQGLRAKHSLSGLTDIPTLRSRSAQTLELLWGSGHSQHESRFLPASCQLRCSWPNNLPMRFLDSLPRCLCGVLCFSMKCCIQLEAQSCLTCQLPIFLPFRTADMQFRYSPPFSKTSISLLESPLGPIIPPSCTCRRSTLKEN